MVSVEGSVSGSGTGSAELKSGKTFLFLFFTFVVKAALHKFAKRMVKSLYFPGPELDWTPVLAGPPKTSRMEDSTSLKAKMVSSKY